MFWSGRPTYYRLELGEFPVPCSWYEAGTLIANFEDRCLAHDILPDGTRISTAFLVFDHNLFGEGPPILWNTIVTEPCGRQKLFGKYSTLRDAVLGHQRAVAVIALLAK